MNNHATGLAEKPPWITIMAGPLFFLAFGLIVYFYADRSIDPAPPGQLGAGFWPKMCLVGIILAAGFKAFELFRCRGESGEEGGACKEMDNFKLALMMLLLVLVVPAIGFVGFPIASVLFFGAFLWLAGARKLINSFPDVGPWHHQPALHLREGGLPAPAQGRVVFRKHYAIDLPRTVHHVRGEE